MCYFSFDLAVKDGRLCQEPVVSSKAVYSSEVSDRLEDRAVTGVITVNATKLQEFSMKIRSGGDNFTSIALKNGEWVFDRSNSGEAIIGVEKDADSLNGIRRMPFSGNDEVTLTIVMDEFSVEIFEDGRSMSSTVYPPMGADGIELCVKADSCQYERSDIIIK